MKRLLKIIGNLTAVLALGLLAIQTPHASAQTTTDPTVTNSTTSSSTTMPMVTPSVTSGTVSSSDPAIINIYPNGGSGILGGGSRLSDLALLDSLFNNGSTAILNGNGRLSLGDFALLNNAFRNSNINNGNFSDLFALGRIFGNGNNDILSNNGTSLGDILILDQLFNGR
jgi:hypothetical protein